MTDSPAIKPANGLYPEIEPYQSGYMATSGKHEIYYEQSGNPNGLPVVVLHGGPGGGTSPNLRCYFDPKAYRIILFDQRGCGKSKPHASEDISLSDNTTWHLVDDIEALRQLLGISTWVVFGGSWGSTLALAYAIKHPQQVRALILRGIFLVSGRELSWFYQDGANALWPDLWEAYIAPIPLAERHDLMQAHTKRLMGNDKAAQLASAQAWSGWEGDTLSIDGPAKTPNKFEDNNFAIAFARIESWYFQNRGFFDKDNWILDHIDAIRHIPAWIIQGRYDVITPMETAWALHKLWPEARFNIISKAGHSSSDPGILDALVAAADEAIAVIGAAS
jgi:proline iminopeptidase